MSDNTLISIGDAMQEQQEAAIANEEGVIGAVLENPVILPEILDYLVSDDFFFEQYKGVWDAFAELHGEKHGIDVITVGDALDRIGLLNDFTISGNTQSGRFALAELRRIGEPRNAMTYVANIIDYKAKRDIMREMNTGANWSVNGRKADDIVKDLIERLAAIKTVNSKTALHTQSLFDALDEAETRTEAARRGEIISIPSGIKDLDRALGGGFFSPDLVIVAGRPGTGKTSLLATIARNAAKSRNKVLFCTLEMENAQIAMRLITMESGIEFTKLRSGKMNDAEYGDYQGGIVKAKQYAEFLSLNDIPAITTTALRQEIRRAGDVDLVIFDYLQLGGVDKKKNNRTLEIGEISRGLKSLCKEFAVPILAGAQLNREMTKRSSKKPVMSDLRESGDIENDADIILMLHRYEENLEEKTDIIIGKSRNGPTGEFPVAFLDKTMQFADLYKPSY